MCGRKGHPYSMGAPGLLGGGRCLVMYKKVFSELQRGSSCPLAGRTGLNKYDQFLAGSGSILGFVWQYGLEDGGCLLLFLVW